jgi:D-alanyl-D-alanine carboxypeptidase
MARPVKGSPSTRLRSASALAIAILVVAACAPATDETPRGPEHPLAAALTERLAGEATGTPDLPGALARITAPEIGLHWSGAAGVVDLEHAEPLTANHSLRIASVTKTFVAAATLRLLEQGRLELDDAIAPLLLPASRAILREGGYDPGAITVRMLLAHTSGLYDYAASPVFFERVAGDPAHRWTRSEQLELAMTAGSAYGAPGERYHYSDTGYILLGEIIEMATARPMPVAVRLLLDFERLGLEHTWFEDLEPEPWGAPPRAHQYQEDVDATHFDPSLDLYGGGGLVSTLENLDRFFRALLGGDVFEQASTLETMIAVSPQSLADGGNGYGLGISRYRLDDLECFGHGGYWGVAVWHCPAVDVTAATAVTNAAASATLRGLHGALITLTAAAVQSHRDGV